MDAFYRFQENIECHQNLDIFLVVCVDGYIMTSLNVIYYTHVTMKLAYIPYGGELVCLAIANWTWNLLAVISDPITHYIN